MEVDFIIVGHGIAGINIAHQLEKYQKSFIVFNNDTPLTSSKIAAGLYNPITGRKMKHTWKAQELFPELKRTYKELEYKLGISCLYEHSIYRPFKNIEEQNDWLSGDVMKDEFIAKVFTQSKYEDFIDDKFGGILLNNCGFLDLKKLIEHHRSHLIQQGIYRSENFDSNNLIQQVDSLTYQDIKAKRIIFCDGPLAENIFFQWVPTAPVKGEILHIIPEKELPERVIFNRGVFIVKHPDHNYYRVGSTYHWKDLNWETTIEAKSELIERLNTLLKIDYKIIGQEAGIRPASKDRRPLIGKHPSYDAVYLFNGLGTKGVSLAPYFSKNLIEHIILGTKIEDEVNINRYYSLY